MIKREREKERENVCWLRGVNVVSEDSCRDKGYTRARKAGVVDVVFRDLTPVSPRRLSLAVLPSTCGSLHLRYGRPCHSTSLPTH